MGTILDWIKRIIRIGILEFLSKLGLKVWFYLIIALIVAALIIGFLLAIIFAILL